MMTEQQTAAPNTSVIKSSKDTVCLVVMGLFAILFFYLVFSQSWLWILSAPLFLFISLFTSVTVATGKIPESMKEPAGRKLSTSLVTTGLSLKSCFIYVQEDIILVRVGTKDTKILMENVDMITVKNESKGDLQMAGWMIDYRDDEGSAKVMFYNEGLGAVKKTGKQAEIVRSAHANYYKGCRVPELPVLDISEGIGYKQDQLVHRA